MELRFDTFDHNIVANKIKEFLISNQIVEVTLSFYNIDEDQEVSEKIKTSELAEKLLDIFEEEGQFFVFYLENLNCKFEYDSYNFSITFPPELEFKLNMFKEDLFSS